MHEQAIITLDNPFLGTKGSLISISVVAKHFPTTARANQGIAYECADPRCKVKVSAVIPVKTKLGRRTSPAPYFRGRHVVGCTRNPQTALAPPLPAGGNKPAHPHRQSAPVVWVDPRAHVLPAGGGTSGGNQAGNADVPGSGGRNGSGTGTSQRRSKIIENFASEWKTMTVHERRQNPLVAPWNPGGNYYSAFFPLRYYPAISVDTLSETIFVGVLKGLVQGTSGYVITLAEKHPNGLDLRIWIQNPTFTLQPGGPAVRATLATLAKTLPPQPVTVYALGAFSKQRATTGKREWYSLIVTHPHLIWIDT